MTRRNFEKLLIIPSIAFLYLLLADIPDPLVLTALAFGFLGDLLLIWSEKKAFFLSGLVSFLIGHLCYLAVFLTPGCPQYATPLWFFIFLIPLLTYGILFYAYLMPYMQAMKIPALVYLTALIAMSFTSLMRIFSVPFWGFLLPFIGSLLFIVSDSLLAYHHFKKKISHPEVSILGTYILAQLLIVVGISIF